MQRYLSLRQAAAQVGVHHTTLARAVQQGRLLPSAATPGGRPRFSRRAVAQYAKTLREGQRGGWSRTKESSQLFRRATLLLTSELRPNVVLQRLTEEARQLAGARYAALAVMDEGGHVQRLLTAGIPRSQHRALGAVPQGRGLLGALFNQGKPLRVRNVAQDPRSVGIPPGHPPTPNLLGVPILSQGKPVGNLYLTDKIGAEEFSEEDERVIEDLAQYAAVAIQNARLFEQATRKAQEWQALSAISSRVVSSLDAKEVLRLVVREARRLLRTDVACVILLEPGHETLRMAASHGLRTPIMRRLRFARNRGLGGAVLASHGPLVVEDYATDHRLTAPLLEEIGGEGLTSLVAVPLEARGQQLGILHVSTRVHRTFTQDEVELVRQLGALAALAVDNARLFEGERAAHLAAAGSEARLYAALEHLPEGAFVVNPQRQVVLANKTASRILLGDEGQRLEGRRHPFSVTYLHADSSPMDYSETPVSQCLAGKGPCLGIELMIQRRDGTRVPLLVNAAPIPDSRGNVASVVVVQQDISRLREVEQMKDDFLSMISHDLKSPLTTIKGLASSMMMASEAENLTVLLDWIRTIDQETDRLTELVNNLLDMSRIEARAMPLDLEECYLVDLATECVERFTPLRGKGAAPIMVDIPADLSPAYADYNQVQRVITNLLANAVKYSEPDTEIHVRACMNAAEKALEVQVEDHGIGIPALEQERIFEKFYRSPHNLSGQRLGSGLGLAICRAIVQAHGGRLWVNSQVGQGSTFSFTLPLATTAGS